MSDVPEGYKMSEVGVIPENWEVKQFGDFAYLSKNYINPQHSKKSYPCIELEHLTQETGLLLGFVESKEQLSQKLIFSKGDVLFGKLRPYLKKFYFAEFDGICTSEIWVIKAYNNAIGQFIFHLIQSNRFLETANQTSGTKMPRADWKTVNCALFPLPPLPEQQATASALSDVDALITALEQLITKKQNIKQGAMQQLLTGKKRLPGFDGEWEVEKIKNISSITTGAKNTQDKIADAEYPFFVRSSIVEGINSYSFDGEAVLTAGDGVGTGKVFHYINGKFDFHQRVYKISDFSEKIDGYFFYLFFSNYFLKRIMAMTAKSSVDSVRMEMIAEMPIPLPPLPEQQAIAQILSDMDTEIEALKQKQDKYKAIKQGMMQELLTGKTRLV
jgi:type I restriction enzyme S subunit